MILPNDIIIRTTSDGTTVWVSQRLVVEYCGQSSEWLRVVKSRYKKSLPASWQKVASGVEFLLSDNGKGWRWGRKGGQYYYDYDRIPDRAPSRYRSALPPREELEALVSDGNLAQSRERQAAARATITETVKEITDNADAQWINTQSGYQIGLQMCRDYSKALAWCRFVSRVVKNKRTADYGMPTVAAFYDACTEVLIPLRIKGLCVSSATSLRNKVATLPIEIEDQRSWIISGKVGNNNRQIVGKYPLFDPATGEVYNLDIHQAIMYSVYMNVGGPEKERLHALYETMYVPAINEFGQIPIAERTFCNHLTRFCSRLKSDYARHGEDYYKKHYMTYTPTEKLSYAHSLFAADGSGLLGYRFTNKENGKLTIMNIYTMLISDVASGYIAGYSVADEGLHNETLDMVKEAVRMAVKNGGNQTMFELVSDNHNAFSSGPSEKYLEGVFSRVRRIEVGNSQGNPAEVQFRLFKNSTLRSQKNFIRSSHGAGTIESFADTKMMEKYDYPTYEEVIVQISERIEVWNNTARGNGKTPAQMFTENKHPECQPLTATALRSVNGKTTTLSVERMRGFIKPEGRGDKVMYEIPNYATTGAEAISRATGNHYDSEVVVIYDETGADLYSSDRKFILTCPVTVKAKMAYIETEQRHKDARKGHKGRKDAQSETVEQHQADTFAATEYINSFEYTENLDYTTAVHFGARKEDINGAAEAQYNTIITEKDKRKANKECRKLELKETRDTEKAVQKEVNDRQSRHIAQQQAKFNRRTENQNQQQYGKAD